MASTQRAISRLVAQAGQMLLAHGAESTLVGDIMRRIGIASGVSEVEVALSANALVVTTVMDGHCITTTRSCVDRGINMKAVTEIQRICIMMEKGVLDPMMAQKKLNNISPERYNRWLVVFMIGISCASFARLAGGLGRVCDDIFGFGLRHDRSSRNRTSSFQPTFELCCNGVRDHPYLCTSGHF